MDKIKLLILEDNYKEAQALEKILLNMGYEISSVENNIEAAQKAFDKDDSDLALLDIYIDAEPKGIELANYINQSKETSIPLIFLTHANDKLTFLSAKQERPNSYLIKPVNPLELQYAIELAIEHYTESKEHFADKDQSSILLKDRLYIKTGNTLHKSLIKDIEFITVDGRYSIIHESKRKFVVQQSLKAFEQKLNPYHFLKVHRNCLVNLNKIESIHPSEYFLTLGSKKKKITISSRYRNNLFEVFNVIK